MTDEAPDRILWTPSPERVAASALHRFMQEVSERHGVTLSSYEDVHTWSVQNRADFWSLVWDFCGMKGTKGERVLVNGEQIEHSTWFPDAKLNFAENLLRVAEEPGGREKSAIVFWAEDKQKRHLTFGELYDQVSILAQHFRALGIKPGDCIAALVANVPEAVVALLAANSVGAIFSSCSPDFGEQLILDRFSQVHPRVLLATGNYFYKGKAINVTEKIRHVESELLCIEETIVIPFADAVPSMAGLRNARLWSDLIQEGTPTKIQYEQLPFNHPLYILYSSGTTGLPKCFVHGQGGSLIQHLRDYILQCDVRKGDRVFYQTTCGWMMWNWQVSALAVGASIALYDGQPFMRDGNILFDYAQEEKFTLFGTSAPFIQAIKVVNLNPKQTHDLSSVRLLTSTGAPLLHEHFDYLYRNVVTDFPVASISGGSDIVGLFVCGNPLSPVRRGEIQGAGLGLDMAVFDSEGKALSGAAAGDLVCRLSFPSMPVSFWNDPEHKKYHAAYFDVFPNVWRHGDWCERTVHGGFIIHGRSDSTTNRQGIRIGTAEFYNLIERLPEIENSLVASDRRNPAEERIIMFLKLREGVALDEAMKTRLNCHMRDQGSPRHVPDEIVQVSDVPITRNAKKAELAVENIIQGKPVTNESAMANPECLAFYREYAAQLK